MYMLICVVLAGLLQGPVETLPVGFRLEEAVDHTRTGYTPAGDRAARTIRVYLWYPAREPAGTPLCINDFADLAGADFNGGSPVPLAQGLDEEQRLALLAKSTLAYRNADFAEGSFPLLILGQGLYYESPLTHVLLCEHLAGQGFVVATCPLKGRDTRLVSLEAGDLEAQIRDLEFVLARARDLPQVDAKRLGVIGFDLGGMSGLVLSMRNPEVKALLSLDAGILYGHSSELPQNHLDYDEARFTVPWMHLTQARFVQSTGTPSLLSRKIAGDSYLVSVNVANHGEFTSYAGFGIKRHVVGYWGSVSQNPSRILRLIHDRATAFFQAYLNADTGALARLKTDPEDLGVHDVFPLVRYKQGRPAPPLEAELLHVLIEQGAETGLARIREAVKQYPRRVLIQEAKLNWLGYHFLYWWGRPEESLEVFKLNVELYPRSANARDSLGEACSVLGRVDQAILHYEQSLQLNPKNDNARQRLQQLRRQ